MGNKRRLSSQRLVVLRQYEAGDDVQFSGADLMRLTGLPSGTLYPALYALEDSNMLTSEWESEDASSLGRPRKRFYRITPEGSEAVKEAMAAIEGRTFVPSLLRENSR